MKTKVILKVYMKLCNYCI